MRTSYFIYFYIIYFTQHTLMYHFKKMFFLRVWWMFIVVVCGWYTIPSLLYLFQKRNLCSQNKLECKIQICWCMMMLDTIVTS